MSRKSAFAKTMDIVCLSSQTARSAGDALRELDSMDVSRNLVVDTDGRC